MMLNEHKPALTFAPANFQQALLRWYDVARRDLPWRANPGSRPDPYRVWLSEIMLQQTVVKAVIPYFEAFLARWPNAEALAEAPLGDVMAAWAGLGYYSRARNLHACAKELARGGFPESEADLRELPGIGAYTAAAIAAIAFGQPAAAVDGNVERVIARLYALAAPLPGAQAAHPHACSSLGAARTAGRLCTGDDGSGGHGLHAALAILRRLPCPGLLPGVPRGCAGAISGESAQGRPAGAARRRLRDR